MGSYSANQRYNDVIPRSTVAAAVSIPVLAADFEEMQFTILTNAAANFDFTVVKSNQFDPPDPSLAEGVANQYEDVLYTDESTGVNYNTSSKYNPAASAVAKSFKVQTGGARWIFIVVSGYVAGALLKCDVDLFSNP